MNDCGSQNFAAEISVVRRKQSQRQKLVLSKTPYTGHATNMYSLLLWYSTCDKRVYVTLLAQPFKMLRNVPQMKREETNYGCVEL